MTLPLDQALAADSEERARYEALAAADQERNPNPNPNPNLETLPHQYSRRSP